MNTFFFTILVFLLYKVKVEVRDNWGGVGDSLEPSGTCPKSRSLNGEKLAETTTAL